VKELSHLPVIVDPSHGTGIRNKVAPMARAAIAAGADGLIIEVHHDPDHALSTALNRSIRISTRSWSSRSAPSPPCSTGVFDDEPRPGCDPWRGDHNTLGTHRSGHLTPRTGNALLFGLAGD
jgi:hypothetical protein